MTPMIPRTDYLAFIFHVNRTDLLQKAVASVKCYRPFLQVLDNSAEMPPCELDLEPGVLVSHPWVPLSASQSLNYALRRTRALGASICITMHEDAEAGEGSAGDLLKLARSLNARDRKWGVIFTNYDCLAAMNVRAADDIGLWDQNLPAYFSDNDWYRRLDLAGWEKVESMVPVLHHGSQTINSDPELKRVNSITFPLYEQYYVAKWGGGPRHETYQTPFNR